MSYHYNEAFENPDYHFSETLEIDRRGGSQRNPFSHQAPYDSSQSDYYGEHRGREQNYPVVAIPMASLGPGSDYSQDLPSTSPYGNFTDNFSFEPEPELTYTPHSTSHMLDYPYTHGISSGSEDTFIRRRNRRPPDEIFMTSSSMLETDPVCREEEDLVGSLASMSSNERIKAIQKMPETMRKKREIRNKVLKEITKKSRHRGAQCTQRAWGVSFRRFGNALSEFFQQLQPWHKTLKIIGAEFGTSVLSYFVFLKWLLNFNIFSFLINCGFITIPQFLAAEPNNLSFTGLELLTGAGYFEQTVLYYGFYTNATISKVENGPSYNMQLAYIFTVGTYFVICFLILLVSMARFFSRNFVNSQAFSVNAASKLLCTWDFNITNEKAVKLQQKNLLTQIKEGLTEVSKEVVHFSVKERVVRIATHLLAWVLSLASAVAACAGVYFLSNNNLKLFMKGYSNDLQGQAAMLVLPVIVSLLNTLIPFFFSWLGHLEKFQTPGQHIYVTIIRNIILKMSIVGILCYYWLNSVATSESQCWETLVGQDIYRLVLVDFIFCLFGSFFGEFLQRIIGTTVCVSLGLPEFDIGRNVLDLIYAQTLTWIGILFSPLLPGIQMIAFLIVFFVKKVSLMRNCQPPRKVWRTAQMTTSFILLLFCPSFLGVLSVIGVTVWRLKPSEECGPFRGLPSMYASVDEWIQTLESYTVSKWVVWIYRNLISSELFFFIISTVVLIVIYLYWQIIQARKTMTKLIRNQIINAGKDKMFLLRKLQREQRAKRSSSALGGRGQQRSFSSYHPSMQPAQELPDYPERAFDRNQNASYNEHPFSVEISSSSDFQPGGEPSPPGRSPGTSRAVALALRARAAALGEDSDGSGRLQPRAGTDRDGSGGLQPWAGTDSDGSGGLQPWAGTDSDGSRGLQPRAGTDSDGNRGFQPRAGTDRDGSGGFQPWAGTDSDGSGGLQPWAGTDSDGSGGLQPWTGTDSDGNRGFQPRAGTDSDGSGGFQPRAGTDSDGSRGFQPWAGTDSDGNRGFQPRAGTDRDGSGGFQPWAGTDSDGNRGFQPWAGTDSDGNRGFQPRAGTDRDGSGGLQPRAGTDSDGSRRFQP